AFLDGKETIGTPGGVTTNDRFSNIDLVAGFDGANNNFGELPAATISGFVFHDKNNNGKFDGTDVGLPGEKISLTGIDDLGNVVSKSTTTLADGSYSFIGLRPGNYTVIETQPAKYNDGLDSIG